MTLDSKDRRVRGETVPLVVSQALSRAVRSSTPSEPVSAVLLADVVVEAHPRGEVDREWAGRVAAAFLRAACREGRVQKVAGQRGMYARTPGVSA